MPSPRSIAIGKDIIVAEVCNRYRAVANKFLPCADESDNLFALGSPNNNAVAKPPDQCLCSGGTIVATLKVFRFKQEPTNAKKRRRERKLFVCWHLRAISIEGAHVSQLNWFRWNAIQSTSANVRKRVKTGRVGRNLDTCAMIWLGYHQGIMMKDESSLMNIWWIKAITQFEWLLLVMASQRS